MLRGEETNLEVRDVHAIWNLDLRNFASRCTLCQQKRPRGEFLLAVFYGKMAKREVKLARQLNVLELSGSSREERSKPCEDKREKCEEDVGQRLLYIVDGSLGHG
jgi:hypothetical protein